MHAIKMSRHRCQPPNPVHQATPRPHPVMTACQLALSAARRDARCDCRVAGRLGPTPRDLESWRRRIWLTPCPPKILGRCTAVLAATTAELTEALGKSPELTHPQCRRGPAAFRGSQWAGMGAD